MPITGSVTVMCVTVSRGTDAVSGRVGQRAVPRFPPALRDDGWVSEWVAWIEPRDAWGYPYDPPRRYIRSQVPTFRLTPSRGLAARFTSESQAMAVAEDRLRAGAAYEASGLVVEDALGRGVSPDAYSAAFRRLTAEAGLRPIRLHGLRHSLATVLHRRGVPPADVARLLGHTLAVHLSTYFASDERGTAGAADAFGEALAAGEWSGQRRSDRCV
jgi:hypothetical protein